MNFKLGFRRIIIVIIICLSLFALCIYFKNGCIFDNTKFTNNIKISVVGDSAKYHPGLFEYLSWYGINLNSWDLDCYPYKQYCFNKIAELPENCLLSQYSIHKLSNNDDNIIKFKILLPTRWKYFLWQLKDFLLIIVVAVLLYLAYLLLEFAVLWVIKGFKEKE